MSTGKAKKNKKENRQSKCKGNKACEENSASSECSNENADKDSEASDEKAVCDCGAEAEKGSKENCEESSEEPEAKENKEPTIEDILKETEAKRDEYLELAQRTHAEYENYRKRVARDREFEKNQAVAGLLKDLIAPIDDIDRGLSEAEKNNDFATLFEGLKLVRADLWKALKNTGFEKIDASAGVQFDPNFHEAMMQMPHPELGANKIVDEVGTGYKIGEMVLRPSKVVVSSGAPQGE
jgi:molecular chaperone GrpE